MCMYVSKCVSMCESVSEWVCMYAYVSKLVCACVGICVFVIRIHGRVHTLTSCVYLPRRKPRMAPNPTYCEHQTHSLSPHTSYYEL